MDVHASLRHLHMAPRKVRLVVDLVRGLPVATAEQRLTFLKRDAAVPVLKLLRSAIANATHNFHLDPGTLIVKRISADAGVTMKRFRPRAMGRSAPIRKRTTHVFLVLAPKGDVGKAVVATSDTAEVKPAAAPKKKPASRATAAKSGRSKTKQS